MKLRLLKRIKNWEESGEVSASDADVNEVMESVRDDLEKLFNTRRGTVLIDPEYGLPDFTHLMNGYSAPDVDEIIMALQFQVKEFETRLSGALVSPAESKSAGNQLKFNLTAQFSHRNQALSLSTNIVVNDNGSIAVSL